VLGARVNFARFIRAAAACALAFPAAGKAAARDMAQAGSVSVTAGVVSDYRFRGISLSDGRPALQAGIEVEHGGWFAGAWGSTVSDARLTGAEVDFYAGRRGSARGVRYSLAAYAYLESGGSQPHYLEVQGLIGRNFGVADLELELSYAPRQGRVRTANLYAGARAKVPVAGTDFAVVLHAGAEDGFYKGKLDWEAGVAWSSGPVTLSASLVGSHVGNSRIAGGGSAAVLSVVRTW
jgi:uncharacterized protein (TIGR02001 family)